MQETSAVALGYRVTGSQGTNSGCDNAGLSLSRDQDDENAPRLNNFALSASLHFPPLLFHSAMANPPILHSDKETCSHHPPTHLGGAPLPADSIRSGGGTGCEAVKLLRIPIRPYY